MTKPDATPSLRARFFDFYERHRRAVWTVHSLWALATGAVVVVLAHESYGYAGWVLGFLVLTWLSTLFFSRAVTPPPEARGTRLRHEVASYLTRVMYQETLFFLLPFYYQSATPDSPNLAFLVLLALLAVLACLDELFDRLLRRHRWFGLLFFAVVSFAALNFLLPLVFGLRLELATYLAAVLGVGSALPIVGGEGSLLRRRGALLSLLPSVAALGLLLGLRILLPPVPLQLEGIDFARDVEPGSLALVEPLAGRAAAPTDRLAAVATLFAPRTVPARAEIRWLRDGRLVESSREIEITPHEGGFRVWDALRSETGPLEAGTYTVAVHTAGGQLIGRGSLRLGE